MQTAASLEQNLEAILFAAGEPIELDKLVQALCTNRKTILNGMENIRKRYREQNSPLDVVLLGDACQMCTRPEYTEVIRATLELKRNTPLSPAALEVLALVAYNQPVTRSFIEQVRGVDCSSIVHSLTDKGLIEEAGRLNIPGKPIAYRTTPHFLRAFGLDSLEQLPTVIENEDPPAEFQQIGFFAPESP